MMISIALNQDTVVAGSVVSGYLIVEAFNRHDISEIVIGILGYAKVTWSTHKVRNEYPGSLNNPKPLIRANEYFVHERCVVWNNGQAPLRHGQYSFSFQLAIPQSCPSSHRNTDLPYDNEIKYVIGAKLLCNSTYEPVFRIQREITVLGYVNIRDSLLQAPVQYSEQLTSLVGNGVVRYTVSMPRTVFCVGEEIQVQVTIQNQSNKNVQVRAMLVVTFTTKTMFGDSKNGYLCKKSEKAYFSADSTNTWSPTGFTVPYVRPAIKSHMIHSQYYLKVVVKPRYMGLFSIDSKETTIPVELAHLSTQ